MIITRTPHRISLIGGGTDFPDWYNQNGGAVIGFAIRQYCYISLRRLPPYAQQYKHRIVYSQIELVNDLWEIDHPAVRAVLADRCVDEGLEIHHAGDVPSRAGLGSSSAFTVGLLNALTAHSGHRAGCKELADDAIRIEQQVINEAVGSQDQCFAAYGGLNRIDFGPEGYDVNRLIIPKVAQYGLVNHLALYYTGTQRIAAHIEKDKIANINDKTVELAALCGLVDDAQAAITCMDYEALGNVIHESWELKRSLAAGVTNSELDAIYEKALRLGAYGGKLVGAGGGGCFLFVVPPKKREALKQLGLVEVPLDIEPQGSRVIVYDNGW